MSHRFGTHDMFQGMDRSKFSMHTVESLQQNRKLRVGTISHAEAIPIEEEEEILAKLDPQIASVSLARPRDHTLAASQVLVRDAFARHMIPEEGGLDIGSGATGYMVGKLLPLKAQGTWTQMELSPAAAAMNRTANPGKPVVVGSYLQLANQNITNKMQVITGLSSLDATGHIDHAIEQIRQALVQGGYLLHVQDTRPGVIIAHQELRHMGAIPPYFRVSLDDQNAWPNDTILYHNGREAYDVIELFRRRIGRAIGDNGGLELLENTWMTAVGPGTHSGMNKHNELGIMVGMPSETAQSFNAASAVITVARRAR